MSSHKVSSTRSFHKHFPLNYNKEMEMRQEKFRLDWKQMRRKLMERWNSKLLKRITLFKSLMTRAIIRNQVKTQYSIWLRLNSICLYHDILRTASYFKTVRELCCSFASCCLRFCFGEYILCWRMLGERIWFALNDLLLKTLRKISNDLEPP